MVELIPAYVWDCPNCGREKFERGLVPEMSPEELQEIRDELGVPEDDMGYPIMMPSFVTCPSCGVTFRTLHYGDE